MKREKPDFDCYKPSPEAFDYDSDVTPAAVKYLQDKADAAMKSGKWKVAEVSPSPMAEIVPNSLTLGEIRLALAALTEEPKTQQPIGDT